MLGRRAGLGVLLLAACTATPTPSPTAVIASPGPTVTGQPSPPAVSPDVACLPWGQPMPSALAGDPCPAALGAVRAAVAPLGGAIAQLRLEPGPFWCNAIWVPPTCAMLVVISGLDLHGWVSFVGTSEVAAVTVSRVPPARTAGSTPGPWTAKVVEYRVPPAGWVMP
jgi:hypothetical protein